MYPGTLISGINSYLGAYCGQNSSGSSSPAYMYTGNSSSVALYYFNSSNLPQFSSFGAWYCANTADAQTNWMGFTDQTASTMVSSSNPAGNYAAFRFVTGTDTYFQCITKDSSTQNVQSSGVAPAAGFWTDPPTAAHLFQIVFTSTPSVLFYIDGVLVATSSSHLPTANTQLMWMTGTKTASAIHNGPIMSYVYLQATI
jgi:hypothetical protein